MESGLISIKNNIFETLLAISSEEQSRGLMHIKPPTPIMSFVYNIPQVNKFWMASTPSPLDIVFCCNNKITQICSGEPYSLAAIGNHSMSDLVIEFPLGTVSSCNFKLGYDVHLVKPTK